VGHCVFTRLRPMRSFGWCFCFVSPNEERRRALPIHYLGGRFSAPLGPKRLGHFETTSIDGSGRLRHLHVRRSAGMQAGAGLVMLSAAPDKPSDCPAAGCFQGLAQTASRIEFTLDCCHSGGMHAVKPRGIPDPSVCRWCNTISFEQGQQGC